MGCIMVFWFAQSMLLLTYSLAGFWKIWASRLDLLVPDGFVRIILGRMMNDALPVPLLAPFLVRHEYLAQCLFLAAVYVEVTAFFCLFRPHLHRPYGVMLILLHFGTDWLMNIRFGPVQLTLGLLMVCSPFSPPRSSWSDVVQSLPLLGLPFRPRAASNRRRGERPDLRR